MQALYKDLKLEGSDSHSHYHFITKPRTNARCQLGITDQTGEILVDCGEINIILIGNICSHQYAVHM